MNKRNKLYSLLVFLTIIVTYLVILAGSIVRATGSGMGCPDWPKCFGQYIPPTDISELPGNYKEIFKVQGKEIADFNAVHTWVEYINRLLGVVMGFLVLGVLIFSLKVRKEFPKMFIFSMIVFLATLFQAWLGAKVVSSNLAPIKITIHMVFALIILAALIYQYHVVSGYNEVKTQKNKNLKNAVLILLVICIVQILVGTQVRQQIDEIAKELGNSVRGKWVLNINWMFDFHKTIAALLVGLCFYIFFETKKLYSNNLQKINLANLLLISIAAEFFVGLILNYASIPAFFQPVHLIFSTIIFGISLKYFLQNKY
jgi:cytochrome c oxidase assembly protein subunit 15